MDSKETSLEPEKVQLEETLAEAGIPAAEIKENEVNTETTAQPLAESETEATPAPAKKAPAKRKKAVNPESEEPSASEASPVPEAEAIEAQAQPQDQDVVNEKTKPETAPEQTEPEMVSSESDEPVVEAASKDGEQAVEESASEETAGLPPFESKGEIVEHLKELVTSSTADIKDQIDALKQSFYRIHKQEIEVLRKAWTDAGNAIEEFIAAEDPIESGFKNILNEWREKRAERLVEQDKQRQANLARKIQIIDEIRKLTESTEDIGRNFPEFRRLQQTWKETGAVPQEQVNELWKSYQMQVERFYDLLKINNEFREYDFKKNLEIKTGLCEAAEKLHDETDVVIAFRQLQKLHEEWRETGPVAKDFREDLWNRFKVASSVINKNHQGFFERLKSAETENLEQKTEICEKIEAIDFSQLKTYKDWDAKTAEIIELQEKWKAIGFAPKKINVKIFERFRAACDQFFRQKSEFYRAAKDVLNQNLEKKKALCEKAEALKESTDWKATSDQLIQIQKEWKTIGPVPKKYSDLVWKRFIAACDFFFEQKEKLAPSQKNEEQKNLAAKKELIDSLKTISDDAPDTGQLIQDLNARWNAIGHVPFKEKDKVYKAWHEAMDALMERLHIDKSSRRLSNFQHNLEDMNGKSQGRVLHERERLLRQFDSLTNEIKTSENNIGFFTTSKSSGNSLLDEMKKKIDELKEERDLIYQKIKMIDDQL